jgi:flagellar biosynthesis/type III secretory pathway M-ring protein FliF/YscJ
MDAFKAQFERIKQQLAALSATQKMLVAALVTVMVMTMMYWGKYAGSPEMVPVLDQTLTEDDIGPIQRQLELADVPYTLSAGKVMVPADRKLQILADLMYAEALPQDTHSAFDVMTRNMNPLSANSDHDAAYNHLKEMDLSQIISHYKGVAKATVIINPRIERHVEGSIEPSATVDIRTRGHLEDPRQMVRAAADGVAAAVSGLNPDRVKVIIDGISRKVSDNPADSSELIDAKAREESFLEQKIRDQFHIAGFTVSVCCDIQNTTTHETSLEYGKNLVTALKEQHEHTEETSTPNSSPRDVGVSPNTGANGIADIGGGAGAGGSEPSTSNISDTETRNDNFVPTTQKETSTPAGKPVVQSATVRVPQSYFVAVYKNNNPTVKDPPEADVKAFADGELAKIRKGVKNVVGLKNEDDLSVESYADLPDDVAMAVSPSAPSETLSSVSSHAKEIAVAALAIVSLFLMTSMVRKSTPTPILLPSFAGGAGIMGNGPVVASDGNVLGSGEALAGEVGATESALDGMELDAEDVRTQQMLDQVSTMVKENPDGAASLVKRWLSRP